MTDYEKFLKGNILPYKGQVIKFKERDYIIPGLKAIIIYTYRISIYKSLSYILISVHKVNVAFTELFNFYCRRGGCDFFDGEGNIYIRSDYLIPVSGTKLSDYFILKEYTLEELINFLRNPGFYIYRKVKYDKLWKISKRKYI